MPVTQITPPGLLDQHSLLVALTPAAIVGAGAVAAAILDWAAPKAGKGITRWLALVNIFGAIIILALFLKPSGAAAAYTEPIGGGLVRIGLFPTGMSLALACYAMWRWNPWSIRFGQSYSTWSWSARIALAMLLPVVTLPALAIASVLDQGPQNDLDDPPHRWWPITILMLTTCGAILIQMSDIPRGCIWICAGVGLIAAGVMMSGPWRIAVIGAGAAICVLG